MAGDLIEIRIEVFLYETIYIATHELLHIFFQSNKNQRSIS